MAHSVAHRLDRRFAYTFCSMCKLSYRRAVVLKLESREPWESVEVTHGSQENCLKCHALMYEKWDFASVVRGQAMYIKHYFHCSTVGFLFNFFKTLLVWEFLSKIVWFMVTYFFVYSGL